MPTFRKDIKLGTKVPLIKTDDLSDKAITTDKLADGSVTNPKLAPESVTQDKFDKELLAIFKAAANLPEDLIQTIQDVDVTLKDHQQQITSNDEDISDLQVKVKQNKDTIDGIAVSGGASVASAVTYDNTTSGLESENVQNAIDELVNNLGHYETNEEWLRLYLDKEGHILWGIRVDGSIEWSVGIPTPIQKKLNELISSDDTIKQTITELREYTNQQLATKVDKEEGKSLIDDEVKDCFKIVENDEFIHCILDAEEHILFAIRRDTGKPYFPLNEMYHVEQNEEYLALWLDSADHILMGIRRDGVIVGEINACNILKKVIADIKSDVAELQSIEPSLKELLNTFTFQENEEFLAIEIDAEGKILSSTNADGSHYIHNAKSETIPEEFSHIDDPEKRMEITTDGDNRILSYRDKNGVKHEHEEEVETLHVSNLDLKDNSVDDIKSALIASGFNVKTPVDWSDSSFIQIPEPRFAIINITNIDSMPTSKTQNKQAYLEFWDMQGNYFKKHAILNAQGNSSMAYVKKNLAIDLCDDEWIGDDTPKLRIGKWVPQDSFHMKAYYTDFFRGVGAVSYKLYDQIVKTRGNMYDRPWKKALVNTSKIDVTTKSLGNQHAGDYSLLTDTGARCFPDGFPVACYLNGGFYGIFSFQLKKHRDNYHMDKSTAEHVHLDGELNQVSIFNGKDNIDWSVFEIRNPKGLYAIGGNKYNADVKQEEIAGSTEIDSWISAGTLPDGTAITEKIKKALQMTAKVKKYIQDFANTIPTIKEAMATYEASSKTEEDLSKFKGVYETYFDKDNIIDYMIVSDIINNSDGFNKNWQWFTYDGKKWWVELYDCDVSFGGHWQGNMTNGVLTNHLSTSTDKPNGYVVKYYNDDMQQRYKSLADAGIISSDNIFSLVKDWTMRIGTSFYEKEFSKWKDSPCIGDSIVRTDYWEAVLGDDGNPTTDSKETFNATTAYSVGDVVSFGANYAMGFFKFKCINETKALASNTPHTVSQYSPIQEFRHCDSIYRIQKWIEKNVENMNKLYNYNK